MKLMNAPEQEQVKEMEKGYDVSRRRFFQLAGGVAGAGILLAACNKSKPTDAYMGSGDVALLNFLYILQQIERDFYIQAVATPNLVISKDELLLLTDVRDQEIAHHDFLKAMLGSNVIRDMATNFASVTFIDRTSVYASAAMIEDMVVTGFNGAAALFTNQDYAVELTKMATVEARHSAYFRDILNYNTFSDSTVVDGNGLDPIASPATVLAQAKTYILTGLDSRRLPS